MESPNILVKFNELGDVCIFVSEDSFDRIRVGFLFFRSNRSRKVYRKCRKPDRQRSSISFAKLQWNGLYNWSL